MIFANYLLQQVQATDADACLSVLTVGGIIAVLMVIKLFGHNAGRWNGPRMDDAHDGKIPNERNSR